MRQGTLNLFCGCASCAPPSGLTRRAALGAGAALMGVGLAGIRPARAQDVATPDSALARLMAGNARFVDVKLQSLDEDLHILREHTAEGQTPFAALLSCADSRVPVELVFDETIGQLFVTRTAGNVAAGDMIASLEYGAAVLGVKLVMVLGHANCGAVSAAIKGKATPGQISGLFPYLQAAVDQAGPDLTATIKANARIQARQLAEASPVLHELSEKGSLKVVAAYYDLASGRVSLV